jgi:ParB-like chromosome segregation protein Spo0J
MQRPEIALISVRKLHPNKRNSRTHSKKQIRQIANSIRRFGWTYPILTDENRVILAGHGRYYAALELGLREVPIIPVSGLSDAEKQALALADNKIAANAGWDRQLLAQELGELAKLLPKYDLDLEITGFETAEIDSLLGELVDPELDPADEVPSPKETVISKIGDLWELGPHRLLCGDAPIRHRCTAPRGQHTRSDGHHGPPLQLANQKNSGSRPDQARRLCARLR